MNDKRIGESNFYAKGCCWFEGGSGKSLECRVHGPLLKGPDRREWMKWAIQRGELLRGARRGR